MLQHIKMDQSTFSYTSQTLSSSKSLLQEDPFVQITSRSPFQAAWPDEEWVSLNLAKGGGSYSNFPGLASKNIRTTIKSHMRTQYIEPLAEDIIGIAKSGLFEADVRPALLSRLADDVVNHHIWLELYKKGLIYSEDKL